ncbi:hypothetical protein ATCC90586_003522 [Pythium insidiosum]|nr:hypothetical protein ATCC90586_003522 [Pythium insidiosum]
MSTMATPDVVRSGAIFRVRNAATMKSPLPRLPGSSARAPRGRLAAPTPEKSGHAAAGASALERILHSGSSTRASHSAQALKRPRGSAVTVGLSLMATRERERAEESSALSARKKRKKKRRKKVKMPVLARHTRESGDEEEEDPSEGEEDAEHGDRQPPATATATPLETMRKFNRLVAKSPIPRHAVAARSTSTRATPPRLVKESMEPEEELSPDTEDGDDDEEEEDKEEEVRVQKRLVYTDTPPAKPKPKPKAARAKRTAPEKRAHRSASPRKVRAAIATLETSAADAVVASTPARTRQRTAVKVLCEWYPMWPPAFVADELQLVICGQVLGQPAAFTVERRVTVSQFVSSDHHNVRLDGCLDIEKAQDAGVPPRVMEVLVEGIPTQWRRRLEPYAAAPEPMSAVKWKPVKRTVAPTQALAEDTVEPVQSESVSRPPRTPAKTKATKKTKVISGQLEQTAEEAAGSGSQAAGVKRSRSGRRLTPVMEWWRNERILTNVDGDSRIDPGSPACIPSSRDAPAPERKSPKLSASAAIARQKIQSIREAQQRSAEWSPEQLQALEDAKAAVCPTGPNFWEEVARLVPGKSVEECRARTFADLTGPPTRRTAGGSKRSQPRPEDGTGVTKIHRAGSNAFKKQVREFVQQYEQRHVDDVFGDSTPSKDPIMGALNFDDLKSPDAPRRTEHASDEDEDGDGIDDVDELPSAGRELLQRVTLRRRDEVDSYVLALKRTHAGLGNRLGRGAVRQRASELETPVKKKTPSRQAVHMVEEVGPHLLEGTVSPGGTTKVRVEKDSDDSDEDELEDDDEMDEEEMDFA